MYVAIMQRGTGARGCDQVVGELAADRRCACGRVLDEEHMPSCPLCRAPERAPMTAPAICICGEPLGPDDLGLCPACEALADEVLGPRFAVPRTAPRLRAPTPRFIGRSSAGRAA